MPNTIMTIMTPERCVEVLDDGTERVTWSAPQPEPVLLAPPFEDEGG